MLLWNNFKQKWNSLSGTKKRNVIVVTCVFSAILVVVFAIKLDKKEINTHKTTIQKTQVLTSAKKNLSLEDLVSEIVAINKRIDNIIFDKKQENQNNLLSDNEEPVKTIYPEQLEQNVLSPDEAISPIVEPNISNLSNDVYTEAEKEKYKVVKSTSFTKENIIEKSTISTYIPAGTTLSFIAISGLNAPTNTSGMKNPMPTLLRIKGQGIMPNGYSLDLADCVIIASGFGQMADERVMLRSEQISCVDNDNKIIEAKIEGTVYGSDGKPGIRGKLVSKTGDVIAQMIKIGTLNTLGQMGVALAGTVNINKHLGGTNGTTINLGTGQTSQIATTTAAQVINDIFSKIAGIYEQYAQQTFPVIEINPGQTGEVIITQGVYLTQNKDLENEKIK